MREPPEGRGATPVCGIDGRGVSTERDEPGANSAGSGDCAYACDNVAATAPPTANTTANARIIGASRCPLGSSHITPTGTLRATLPELMPVSSVLSAGG